jgi:exodeoxyribonuclease III
MKLTTWNINGIRAVVKKGFWEWFETEMPDSVCLQEIKADDEAMTKWWADTLKGFGVEQEVSGGIFGEETQIKSGDHFLSDYNIIWHACSIKKGYSGTAIIYKKSLSAKALAGIGKSKFDDEGRTTILQIDDVVLINCYYPQGGRPERIPFKLEFYEEMIKLVNNYKKLGKKVIICGDLNTTVTDIDLARPKENRKTTGCLPEEREALDRLIKAVGVDSFRYLYSDTTDKYTYWDQITRARERNVGWRIDYMIVDNELAEKIEDVKQLDQVMGSDHCPVMLKIRI